MIFGHLDCLSSSLGVTETNSRSQSIRRSFDLVDELMMSGFAFLAWGVLTDIMIHKYISIARGEKLAVPSAHGVLQ